MIEGKGLNLIGFKKGIKFRKMIEIAWFSVRSLFAGATRKRKAGGSAGLPATLIQSHIQPRIQCCVR